MNFKKFVNIVKVGIVGFSDDSLIASEEVVRAYFHQGLKDLGLDPKKQQIVIVAGTTNMGVPRICYEEAVKLKLKTVGITANEAKQYDLFNVDESFFVGEKFGDESDFFLNYIDCLIKIGGGKQSVKEFKNFSKEKVEYDLEKGTYAAVRLSEEDADYIHKLCKQMELPNITPKKDFHITLLYSRKYLPDFKPEGNINETCKIDKLHVFPTFDKKRALVLKVKSSYLTKRHNELMKEHGATYDYDSYISHITLSYDIGDMRQPALPEGIKKELQLVSEYAEELNLEWKPKK